VDGNDGSRGPMRDPSDPAEQPFPMDGISDGGNERSIELMVRQRLNAIKVDPTGERRNIREVSVFYADRTNNLYNGLFLFTLLFALAVAARVITSITIQLARWSVNMKTLLIIDAIVFVLGVFIFGGFCALVFIFDNHAATFRHTITVLMPLIIWIPAFGVAYISLWNATRLFGSYVDWYDYTERIAYNNAHIYYTAAGLLVLSFIPQALYSHLHPERRTFNRYVITELNEDDQDV